MNDPWATLEARPELATPQANAPVSLQLLEVPVEDQDLVEQLRNNPRIADLRDEIALAKYLRVCLQRSIEARSAVALAHLGNTIIATIQAHLSVRPELEDQLLLGLLMEAVEPSVRRALAAHIPALDINLNEAKAFREMLLASGKLAEQYKKITDGMVLNVKMDMRILHGLLNHVVMPNIPRKYWPAIAESAERYAPQLGSVEQLEMDQEEA